MHRISIRAERKVEKELIADFKRVSGKNNILFRMATASLDHPEECVKDVIYPVVSPSTLQNLVKEFKSMFGLGTNTGLKRISTGGTGENYPDLLYIKRRYIHKENLRNAIGMVVNAIFQMRAPHLKG